MRLLKVIHIDKSIKGNLEMKKAQNWTAKIGKIVMIVTILVEVIQFAAKQFDRLSDGEVQE